MHLNMTGEEIRRKKVRESRTRQTGVLVLVVMDFGRSVTLVIAASSMVIV